MTYSQCVGALAEDLRDVLLPGLLAPHGDVAGELRQVGGLGPAVAAHVAVPLQNKKIKICWAGG